MAQSDVDDVNFLLELHGGLNADPGLGLCGLMTPERTFGVMYTVSKFANRQIRHQATHNEHGECIR